MLTKRNLSMTPVSETVKKSARLALTALIVMTAGIAPSALAVDSPLIDVEVSVKFRLSDLETANGTEKVYAKMVRKAERSCWLDQETLDYLNQTVEECAADIVEQLVYDSEIEALTAYHEQKTLPVKTIKLASTMP